MKKIKYLLMISIMLFLLIGCGKDGADGKAFISFTWSTLPEYYTDDNSSTPSTIYKNTYYKSPAGTFNFEYAIFDNGGTLWLYWGTYRLTVNEGEPGGFLTNGSDGADKYFDMYLGVNGPGLSKGKFSSFIPEDKNIVNYEKSAMYSRITENVKNLNNLDKKVIELKQGLYTLKLEYYESTIILDNKK